MRISLSSNELLNTLQKLSKGTPARSTLPILSCVLIEVDNNGVFLRTTDLEIAISCKTDASIEDFGSAAIPLQTLLEIASELQNARITITVNSEQQVELTTDSGKYDLMGKPVEEFPALPDTDNRKASGIDSETLKEIIKLTTFAISKDELKPALTGVLFRFENNKLTTVATDGHRMVRFIKKEFKNNEFVGDVIIPRKFLNLMSTFLMYDEEIQIWVGDNNLTAQIGPDTIYTRLIDERYPDFESVIPVNNEKIVTVKKEQLLSAVKRVSIFSNRSTHQIALEISESTITIKTEDPEKVSKGKESIQAKLKGDDITIGYNAAYLKDILLHIDSEFVVMMLKTPISAGLILPEKQNNKNDITFLLMPIRLND